MDKIHFPYRSISHPAFLHVAAESGSGPYRRGRTHE